MVKAGQSVIHYSDFPEHWFKVLHLLSCYLTRYILRDALITIMRRSSEQGWSCYSRVKFKRWLESRVGIRLKGVIIKAKFDVKPVLVSCFFVF
jgi:hypothetical protein